MQHLAPEELRVISQPPGRVPISRYHNYVYRTDSKKQIFIYHAELGINADHRDFADRPIEWLYTNRTKFTGNALKTESPSTEHPGHSTCTASKAAGKMFGASRLATLVVVKMPDLTPASTAEVFSTITDHILEKQRQGQSIVTASWGSKVPVKIADPDPSGHWSYWRSVRRDLQELTHTESVVLLAAGNAAQEMDRLGHPRLNVDTAPAIFAAEFDMLRLLVVSNVDNAGWLWRTSQTFTNGFSARFSVFAPGVQVKCAAHNSNSDVGIKTGTSFCTPRSRLFASDLDYR